MLVCISWYLICKSSLSFQIPKPIFEVVDMDTKDTRLERNRDAAPATPKSLDGV